jgi:hypothetical protein
MAAEDQRDKDRGGRSTHASAVEKSAGAPSKNIGGGAAGPGGAAARTHGYAEGGEVDEKKKSSLFKHHGLDGKEGRPPEEDKLETDESETGTDTSPPATDQNLDTIDADSIIDAFLEANPELVDVPVEDWPEDAIEMLKDTFNTEHVDAPNGVLPAEEDAEGEPADEGQFEEGEGAPDPEQDFDIAELSKLVEAGDKDGAWNMLQNMFGVTPDQSAGPTNALDKMTPSSGGSSNALAKIIGGLKF